MEPATGQGDPVAFAPMNKRTVRGCGIAKMPGAGGHQLGYQTRGVECGG
jgi:hypothetical protein